MAAVAAVVGVIPPLPTLPLPPELLGEMPPIDRSLIASLIPLSAGVGAVYGVIGLVGRLLVVELGTLEGNTNFFPTQR